MPSACSPARSVTPSTTPCSTSRAAPRWSSDRYRSLATGTGIQVANTVDDTRWGGVVGVGLEYGFAPNWSVAIEYDHMFMQDKTYTFINNGVAGVAGTLFGTDTHPSGRRSGYRPHQLPLGWPGRREVLIFPTRSRLSYERPALRRPFCLSRYCHLLPFATGLSREPVPASLENAMRATNR